MRPKFTRKVVKTTETPLIVSSIDYVESHRPQLRENRRSSVARRYLMSDIPINVSKSDSYQYKEFYRNASGHLNIWQSVKGMTWFSVGLSVIGLVMVNYYL